MKDFPGGPVVKNLPCKKNPPCNAGEAGLIPKQETKILHAAGQLRPHASNREPTCCNCRESVPQPRPDTAKNEYFFF